MLIFTTRSFETIAVADRKTPDGIRVLDDTLNEQIDTGTAIFTASIEKNHPDAQKIEVGNFVFVVGYRQEPIALEIMELQEFQRSKEFTACDAGLDLINEDVGALSMKGTLKEFVNKTLGEKSGWEIGTDEIGTSKNITLEYESNETKTKRLVQIAGRFGAEVSYSFAFQGSRLDKKLINFHKKRGKEEGRRLEFGKEVQEIKRHVSITELCTAVRAIGQPHKETIKEKKIEKVTETPKEETTTNGVHPQIEKFVGWMLAREGKVRYSQARRGGPSYYDCSSSVSSAARHAGLMPNSGYLPTTGTLMSYGNQGKYFHQISKSEIRYGDIFVSRTSRGTGHTGVFLSPTEIIHCTKYGSRYDGIVRTKAQGWMGGGTLKFFRFNGTDSPTSGTTTPTTPTTIISPGTKKGTYWTNSDITRHNLGKSLSGLTAEQLNNWVKSTSPSSPFCGNGNIFIEAQKQSGLDARYILAHAAYESGWGKSRIARSYHNYFGINAYDNNPDNARKSSNDGMRNGIINGAKWIKSHYYDRGQTTLYTMRHDPKGSHNYATGGSWHTDIASMMKKSERYTNPSTGESSVELKEVEKIVEVEKEIDVDTNLIGYKYDDGRFFVTSDGILCDRETAQIWSRYGEKDYGYIIRIYDSQAQSQKTLFDEALRYLEMHNTPKIDYEVDLEYLPDDIEIGDVVRIIDHEYNPSLYLDARVIEMTRSLSDPTKNQAVFSNFVERKSGISDKLLALQDMVKSMKWDWASQPYQMTLTSSSGNTFKDGIIESDIRANVTKAGIDQTAIIDRFVWERVSTYPDKVAQTDEDWNAARLESGGNVITITTADVDLEASFVCSAMIGEDIVISEAITIKDLTIGQYKQDEEPPHEKLQWGDVWQSVAADPPFKKIWKGDGWEDVILKKDVDKVTAAVDEVASDVTEIKPILDEKADTESLTALENRQQAIEIHVQQFPSPESLGKTQLELEKTQNYLEALKTAIDSDALTLEDRLAIIEANVGAGKLSLEAITTYLNFGEEGVLIGKQGEQVKMTLKNDALEIVDGTKVVARFGNNFVEVPNLSVSGTLEFGYHVATRFENAGKRYTVVRPK